MVEKIEVENVNCPGKTTNVNASKYLAMKAAFLTVLPNQSPGLNQNEIVEKVVEHLPETLFPKGSRAAWWAKTVQLDLEAKKRVIRENSKPLRWYKKEITAQKLH